MSERAALWPKKIAGGEEAGAHATTPPQSAKRISSTSISKTEREGESGKTEREGDDRDCGGVLLRERKREKQLRVRLEDGPT